MLSLTERENKSRRKEKFIVIYSGMNLRIMKEIIGKFKIVIIIPGNIGVPHILHCIKNEVFH